MEWKLSNILYCIIRKIFIALWLMKKGISKFLLGIGLLAGVTSAQAQSKQELDSLWNDWNFRINPYFWFMGLEGEIVRPPQITNPIEVPSYEIDVSFKDIHNSIKFGIMLSGQYKTEKLVAQFNFSTLIMESDAITPLELILQNNTIKLNYYSGDLGFGYRIIRNGKIELDALGVLKFISFNIGLSTELRGQVQIEGERGHAWMDPSIGVNFKYRPYKRIEFSFYGDFGSTLLNTDVSYQTMMGLNYLFSPKFLATLGYRYYYLDVPEKDAIFNGSVKGMVVRLGFQF